MPSLWGIDLCGGDPTGVRPEYIHAVVSRILDDHSGHHDQRKRYTVRPLEALGPQRCRLVVGLLDDDTARCAYDLVEASPATVRLGSQFFSRSGPPTLLAAESWAVLAEEARPVDRVALRFVSPTFFRRGNAVHVLPAPSVVFGHLRRRWSDCLGVAPECALDDRAIQVGRLDVQTVTVRLRGRDCAGFVGTAEYHLDNLETHERAALDAFARLAPYAGCGAATTFGFGAVDRLAA